MRTRRKTLEKAVGETIRMHRKGRRLTQEAAAERAGMNWRHWQKIETGEGNPCVSTISRIAASLGVHPAALFEVDV